MKLSDRFTAERGPQAAPPPSDLERVFALPRRVPEDTDLTPEFRHRPVCGRCPLCAKGPAQLWPIQSAMLAEARLLDGLFASVACGAGKTLCTLLLPQAMKSARAVLFVKPSLIPQLMGADVPLYSLHYRIPRLRVVAGDSPTDFATPFVAVVPYSLLSSAKRADILNELAPDLIISDEAHSFRAMNSSRTMRFIRYMRANLSTRFAALSGTMTTRSLADYWHLITFALRKRSPLPLKRTEMLEWAAAVDSETAIFDRETADKLSVFCSRGETLRQGFRRRLVETPGVVATSESALGSSLIVDERVVALAPPVKAALDEVHRTWCWNGDELEDPLAMTRVARQLSQGFYYKWDWPRGVVDEEWLIARNAWHREVRNFLLDRARDGMDSPLLLAQAAATGKWISKAWEAWSRVKHRPQPPVIPVWISDYLLQDVIAFGRQIDGPLIVWYEHQAIGERLAQLSRWPHFGAGDDVLLTKVRGDRQRIIICSQRAHGTGRNLQTYSRNLILCSAANGAALEQQIARTHRPGQADDEVRVTFYLHTPELRGAVEQAMRDAKYIEETTGQRQKLLYSTCLIPLPKEKDHGHVW